MLPLVDKDDVVSSRKKESLDTEKNKTVTKKKPEKPVRILRIRYYQKLFLPYTQDGKLEKKEIFAVNRGLEDLLKELYCNTNIQGMSAPLDCIFVEKDKRIGANDKFIFLQITTNEFFILKRQLENHTTIYAYNKGEFSILDGKMSFLSETWNIPRIWKEDNRKDGKKDNNQISETNVIIKRQKLREELKDKFRSYHSYEDEDIDNMKNVELIELKRLVNKKVEIENKNRKFFKELLT